MPPKILIRAPVASFTCWNAVSIASVVYSSVFTPVFWGLLLDPLRLVEVLSGVGSSMAHAGAVEVVEHQIHILLFVNLQEVADLDIAMHLNFDVRVSLSAQGPGLIEVHRLAICLLPVKPTSFTLPCD